MLAKGGWCDSDLDPRLFYRQLICAARGVKCKNTLAFCIHSTRGRWPLLGVEAEERNIYKKPDAIQAGTQDLEKNPPCNAEDNLRAGLIAIEAWFGGY